MSATTTARTAHVPRPPTTLRLLAPPAPEPGDPEWVGRAWQSTARELRRYARTSWVFGLRPRESARRWSTGQLDAQNPLAFLLNTVAVLGPWRALWQLVLDLHDPLWLDVLWAAMPFVGVVVLNSATHALIKLSGGKRHLASTWAVSIYATGGLVAVFQMAATPFIMLSQHIKTPEDWHRHWLAFLLGQLIALPPIVWHALALSGLHGVSARRIVVLQLVVIAVFFVVVSVLSVLAVVALMYSRRW